MASEDAKKGGHQRKGSTANTVDTSSIEYKALTFILDKLDIGQMDLLFANSKQLLGQSIEVKILRYFRDIFS